MNCNYLSSGNYVQDWAESDSCQCTHVSQCCFGVGVGNHYSLFDSTCGLGSCWSGCLGPSLIAIKGAEYSVFFLTDGNLLIKGTLQQNTPALQTADNELVIRNSSGSNVAVVSESTGNMVITGALYQDMQGAMPSSSPYSRFIARDAVGNTVSFIDELGNLYLRGNLTEDAGSIMRGEGITELDTTPPIRSNGAPSGVLSFGTTSANLTLDTNEAATCRYSTTPGLGYDFIGNTFGTTGGTSHLEILNGLSDGSSYDYYVKCKDAVGNLNEDDYTISFSVAAS